MVMVTPSPPYGAKNGDPVAVVYYRCEPIGGPCTPRAGFYYVHNGVALKDLPTNDGGAPVSHVPQWNQTAVIEKLYICGAAEAAKASPSQHGRCAGNEVTSWRPWVVKAIYTYPIGQPIAWRATVGGKTIVHNGVFKCFNDDPDIRKVVGKGTLKGKLEYWHYVNANPDNDEVDGRTAKWWQKFTLQSGSVPEQGKGTADIEIVQRP